MDNQGNEGDEILFYSLRQSLSAFYDFPVIPVGVGSVADITPDILVEVVIRTLQIITQNEEQLPVKLPENIAARHRICASIAKTVKENGFIGECGYNQLLYPAQDQTRNLLNWVVEKLPKLEEGQSEEDLGSNACLNRRLRAALAQWSNTPLTGTQVEDTARTGIGSVPSHWTVPFCASSGGQRQRFFRTVPHMLAKVTTSENKDPASSSSKKDSTRMCVSTLEVFKRCRLQQQCTSDGKEEKSSPSIGPCILEKHALELADDSVYTLSLETDYASVSAARTGRSEAFVTTAGIGKEAADLSSLLQTAVKAAIKQAGGGSRMVGVDGLADEKYDSSTTAAHNAYMNGTLQELLSTIVTEDTATDSHSSSKAEGKESRFAHAMKFSQESTASAIASSSSSASTLSASLNQLVVSSQSTKEQLEAENEIRQVELQELKRKVLSCTAAVEQGMATQERGAVKIAQFEKDLTELNDQAGKFESSILIKKKTIEMLPSATESIRQLQAVSDGSRARLVELEREWESHRVPLMDEHTGKVNIRDQKRERCRSLVENMKELKHEMTAMVGNLREKQDRSKVLEEELCKLPKHLQRSTYTHRIMEITASIMKQEEGIDKITADIIDIQKTINRSRSAVQRADTITEELIYSAASDKNDSVMVDTYRNLRNLRSKFEDLLDAVDKLGQQNKQERTLSTKIDQERSRVSANNFDRIKADLDAIVEENAVLVSQIKSISKKS
jgi:hypothetical protein